MITPSTSTERTEAKPLRPLVAGPADVPDPRSPALPLAKQVTVVRHPVAQHALTMLRNRLTAPHQFRSSSNQLLSALLHEATRSVPLRTKSVTVDKEPVAGQVFAKPVVFLTIARHALGFGHRMAELFPELLVGTISYDPAAHGRRINLPNAPAFGDAKVIIFDPVVATGTSSGRAVGLVRRIGATDISLLSFVISTSGLEAIHARVPEVQVWTGAIDPKLDAHKGPLPGVGDFAARMFA